MLVSRKRYNGRVKTGGLLAGLLALSAITAPRSFGQANNNAPDPRVQAENGTSSSAGCHAPVSAMPPPSGSVTGNAMTLAGEATNAVRLSGVVPPVITSIFPTSGLAGTPVTIVGRNFGASQGNSSVEFNAAPARVTSWGDTQIVAPVPLDATAGNVIVTVNHINSNGMPIAIRPALEISSPVDGTIVNPGHAFSVSVTSPANISFTEVGIMGQVPIDYSGFQTSVPAHFSITIPIGVNPATYALSAIGMATSGESTQSDPVLIDVEQQDMPLSISASEPSMDLLGPGITLPLTFLGTFSNGKVLDVTRSSYVGYTSSNSSTATVESNGMVTAAAPGFSVVTATYKNNGHSVRGFIDIDVPPPVLTPSAYSISFGNQVVGTASRAQKLTLTNDSIGPVRIRSLSTSGDFSETDNCMSSPLLPSGGACSVSITFSPGVTGRRTGTLQIVDQVRSVPTLIPLAGIALSCQ